MEQCANSEGSGNVMTDCIRGLNPCKRNCPNFVRRSTPKNEDEKQLQSLEWG